MKYCFVTTTTEDFVEPDLLFSVEFDLDAYMLLIHSWKSWAREAREDAEFYAEQGNEEKAKHWRRRAKSLENKIAELEKVITIKRFK